MTTEKYLTYRGDVKALAGAGGLLTLVTVHPEGQASGIYRLDAEKLTLEMDPLPAGAVALAVTGDTVWAAGSDGHVYQYPLKGGKPTPRGPQFASVPVKLAPLAKDRLAVLTGAEIAIIAHKDGKVIQRLELPETGTCLAADPTGAWLVAGTVKGSVAVFDGEDKAEFQPSESARLHEGAVTALLFEPEELRFFSAGADQKLLSTHARGKLEPEDRGRGNNHTDTVTALIGAPGDRFLSGSRDSTVKTWPRTGGARPATLKDGVGRVVDLAIVSIHNRPHLVAACDDNTLRVFLLDAAGKFGDATHRIYDAYAWAENELSAEAPRREAALRELAGYADTPSIERISRQVANDGDNELRLLATQLLGKSTHPRAAKLLETCLGHRDEAVRVAAFHGLRRHLGDHDLHPLNLALKADRADVGRLAVQALETLAKRDDQALARLMATINAKTLEVRQAALTSLENVHDAQSPEASLLALGSKHADLRRLALLRLWQRQLLESARVQAALRRRMEDADAEVRRTAFLLSLYTRPKLVAALQVRDPELARQFTELDSSPQEPTKEKKSKPAKARESKLDLDEADFHPLLQATASRSLDTCLRGGRGLAVLGDPRAFGLLLQLSREDDAAARVEVCRALSALDDPRSIKRLRSLLYDPEPAVRDAAFSALMHIHTADPLLGAESGLNASFEDVRRRGLQALIAEVRKKPPTQVDEPAWQLLVRALNDSFEGVRSEAFKAALNLQIGGGQIKTLRFVLQSIHANIRREVLTEVMAQFNETWAWNLLLEFYNDHDPQLRSEAFEFAVRKSKELEPLAAGLRSQYADIRRQSVEALIKKRTSAAQVLLVQAVDDPDRDVRLLALDSLVGADAQEALSQALKSPHDDVRVRAARALARHGRPEVLPTLLKLATREEPAERERQRDWLSLVELALEGLTELGDTAALEHLVPLLDSKHASIRQGAARALTWVAVPHHPETLRRALQHADPQVKYRAALGLAYAGDPLVASLVFTPDAGRVLSAEERLVAALTLGAAGEDQLVVALDDEDEAVRNQALMLLMLLEMKTNQGTPARCLAALSSRMPRVRLAAARALESFSDPAAFLQFVVQLVNDRADEPAWKIDAATVDTLAELVAHGSPQLRARTAHLVRYLASKEESARGQAAEAEQAAWNLLWKTHAERFAAEITRLQEQARKRTPMALPHGPEQLKQLAFGAYVGLVREQGAGSPAMVLQAVRVRQTAMQRIMSLASADAKYAPAAQPVLVQALGDPNQEVRLQAFAHLQTLGMERTALAAEALEAGHTNLGVKGLELLTQQASAAEGQGLLEQAMLTRTDDLALEAALLLIPQRGSVAVAGRALEAASEELRKQAVTWLAGDYDKDETARTQLREALNSRYQKVRNQAAMELAGKKDAAAFPALVKLLASSDDAKRQRRVIDALVTLGDPHAPDAFLDRIENDPAGTALVDELLRAAGGFRRPENADRLLTLMDRNEKWRPAGFDAVLAVSGHDQAIDDPEDELPDRRWEEMQFPRHDTVLTRLLEWASRINEPRYLARLLQGSRWARGKEVEPALALLANHANEALRRDTVAALAWRLRKRQGSPDGLLKVLSHRDAVTQFLAAEGLARAGRAEGINVLLASIDFLSDLHLRRRAVQALGELADVRALDTLLRLVGEDGHALQESAAEAIGHLGRSDKADDIFKLLERFARGNDGMAENALKGLRWLNTRAGWQLVRKRAAEPTFPYRQIAVNLLGYNDDPATRDLLLHILREEAYMGVVIAATTSALRLFGKDSLEVDYAWLQNPLAEFNEDGKSLRRVGERGEVRRTFAILSRCPARVQDALATSLLNRQPLPIAEATTALDSPDERTTQLAAQIVGRAGSKAAAAGSAVESTLTKWRKVWEERRRKMAQENVPDEHLLGKVTPCVQSLVWAAGRLGIADEALRGLVTARTDDGYFRSIRLVAVAALAAGKLTEADSVALESAALGNDPEVRGLAADALGRQRGARTEALAGQLLSDRVSFNRLTAHQEVLAGDTLRSAVGQLHYQGVAIPHLVAHHDLPGLSAVLDNRKLPEAVRLGAIEALGKLGDAKAEAKLAGIGASDQEDEDLRKAAWRALRRSRRARRQAEVKS